MTDLDEYWNDFITKTNRSQSDRCSGDLFFDSKGNNQASLNSLVLSGQKTAFFTPLATYTINQEPIPISGELYIVVDNNGEPVCVIETQSIEIVPFEEISWQMAKLEGEDNSFEEWKNKQIAIISDEGDILGFEFSPDIRMVFKTFNVIYK